MKNRSLKTFAVILFLFVIYGYFIEPNILNIRNYNIQDKELSGVKIVFASDFHVKLSQEKKLEKIVEKINQQNADFVVSTGDFISGHKQTSTLDPIIIAEKLGNIKAKYGFYTTLGNHDNWYDGSYIEEILENKNIKVLNNKNTKLNIQGKEIFIAGVKDLMTSNPDIEDALKNAKSPTILLTHSPDIFPNVPSGVNLTLAGHTHGGQIRLPIIGALVTPSEYGNKYTLGLIEENGKKLITTKGIGTSILPIRFLCPPEIVVINFIK